MSLKGSLETVGLTDVLTLLAMTKKTGELQVTGPGGDGRLWLDEGRLIGSSAGRGPSHVDALFELLRVKEGSFSFEDGQTPSEPGPATEVEPLLAEAATRLTQWGEIEASIPSLAFVVSMAPNAPMDEVIIRADQWRLLAAAGGGKPVSAVLDLMALGEFDGCKALKELADEKLVIVEEPSADVVPPVVPADEIEAALASLLQVPPVAGEVDLSPVGDSGGIEFAPIDAPSDHSDHSDGPSDFEFVFPTPEAADVGATTPTWSQEPYEDVAGTELAPPVADHAAEEAPPALTRRPRPSDKSYSAGYRTKTAERPAGTDDPPAVTDAVATPAKADVEAHAAVDGKLTPVDEPINRGLLLKFLSSVRN
jgi:hypothetical protein